MTAVSLVAIFGFTALSVDLGNAWQNRRQLVNSTDASALAAVQEYALGGNGCTSVAGTYLSANKSDATLVSCSPSEGAVNSETSGDVLVTAQSTVDYAFAPVIGYDSKVVSSTTVARYGIPISVGGLRPFGLCLDALVGDPLIPDSGVQEYIDWMATDRTEPSAVAHIEYSKDANPNACNGGDPVPGNWATMDFDGGGNSNADIQNWTLNGYPGQVGLGEVPGDTGAFSPSLAAELSILRASGVGTGMIFQLPLFGSATGTGSNSTFDIVGFVSVRIEDFQTSGSQEDRSLDLQFVKAIAEGVCCDEYGIDTGTYVLQICAVHTNDRSDCEVG